MANLIGILQSGLFVWGTIVGSVSLIVVQILTRGRAVRLAIPVGGLLLGGGGAVVMYLFGDMSILGLVGLAVSGVFSHAMARAGSKSYLIALASLPGAVVASLAAPPDPAWMRPLMIILIPLVAWSLSDFDRRYHSHGLGMVFACLATAGTFLAVPDTEWARALFAVALPTAFLAWPRVIVSLGISGAYVFATAFVLATVVGGVGRPASIVGALAGLGMLVIEPVAVRLRPTLSSISNSLNRAADTAILASMPQVLIVLAASRVAARFTDVLIASVLSVGLLAGGYLILVWVGDLSVLKSAPSTDA